MEAETVIVKDAREVFNGDTLDQFSRLVEDRLNAKVAIAQAEKIVKQVDEKLTELMALNDCDKVMHGRHRCQIISKTNSRLDKEKLMMNGVPVAVIERSMTVSYSSYLEIREIKDKAAAA